jgi:hypothetical protein
MAAEARTNRSCIVFEIRPIDNPDNFLAARKRTGEEPAQIKVALIGDSRDV